MNRKRTTFFQYLIYKVLKLNFQYSDKNIKLIYTRNSTTVHFIKLRSQLFLKKFNSNNSAL